MGTFKTLHRSILLLVVLYAQTHSQKSKSDDTQGVPSDLRRVVSEAIALERRFLLGAKDGHNCTAEEDDVASTPCPPSKYRSASGECNNVRHRPWGRRGDIFLRLLPPQYADGVSQPLSSPRLPEPALAVHAAAQLTATAEHDYVTSLLAAWGQFVLDDIVATANGNKCEGPTCEYSRSAPARNIDSCGFEHREQMNLATSFLDGSALYGSSEKELRSLRLYDAGKLDVGSCRKCNDGSPTAPLYKALLSEHNRVAGELYSLNPFWDDTTLFLETRRAMAAIIQHITYNEFLPVLLGEVGMAKAELKLTSLGFWRGYSSANRAGAYSELVAVAPVFKAMMNENLKNATLYDLIHTSAHRVSRFPSSAQWDLNRARDHGVASYLKALRLCEPTMNVKSYGDLEKLGFDRNQQEMMADMYRTVEDVELMIGGAMERPASGAVVGNTFACVLALQFANLKKGDRFWYENDIPPSSFLPEKLAAIRKVSLAGLLCAADDALSTVQPAAFVKEDPYLNAAQQCSQHNRLELTAWRDESGAKAAERLNQDMVAAALEKAKQEMAERKRLEYMLWEARGGADPKSPVGTAASFSKANKYALKLANTSLFFEFATNELLNSLNAGHRRKRQIFDDALGFSTTNDFVDSLQSVDVSGFIGQDQGPTIEPQCDDMGSCDPDSPFRTYTGYCNNLRNPNLGKSLTTFARLLPPVYEDGVSRPRINSVTGTPLPSPRIVSTVIHPDISNLHTRYTLMVMQFAQFLDHELTMTPIHKGFHESIPDCRSCDSPRTVHPECNPFPVPRGDHYYPEVNVTSGERLCFPFMRSLPGQQQLGPREQVNQNTAYIDASVIYGENPCIVRKLRGFNGRLNATDHPLNGKDLLPRSDNHPECKAPSGYCFIAGDGRASEQPGLTAIHTIFLREHNRIVEGLRGVNPHWDADLLFEHTRRIVAASFTHIIYNEFLPRLLSWNAVNLYGLKLLPSGYYKEYSPTCNPAIVTEFAAAAFRIGHSLLRPHLPRLSPTFQPVEPPILLRDGFFKPDMFINHPAMVDELMRGLASTPMETLDQFITGEVTNHLFEDRRVPFSGVDLIALNIQRGRDHGVPSYNNYRALCNLKRAATFEDLSREIPDEVIARLKRIYPTVDDIDLFPGGMSERPLQGGLVGPTFACIIAIQFRQLRKCDRFWYENDNTAARFTERQLSEIRKMTLSKLLCENFDVTTDIQRAAFDLPSNFLNPRVPCSSLPQIDLSAWRESSAQGCLIAGRNVAVGDSAFPSPCTSCICTNEGAQCASLRITDCAQLLREWPREAVLRDDVCTAQCGGAAQPAPNRAPRRPHLNFKFPDLSPFVAK
ncbi:heme peroxidase 2 isoform X2 [Pectinophora gossypiella]|uniref:heme peroxidase 2 isoform X2 n=1 Tax=Pectinophora gossypiella TaxID=13191 RepID=UPI00214EAB23|nr:heme peroxidase 2 isoform X2 [Pectinophora gossypiella]